MARDIVTALLFGDKFGDIYMKAWGWYTSGMVWTTTPTAPQIGAYRCVFKKPKSTVCDKLKEEETFGVLEFCESDLYLDAFIQS